MFVFLHAGATPTDKYRYYGRYDNLNHQITNIDCNGKEGNILECTHSFDSYCSLGDYDAGVICQSKISVNKLVYHFV